MLGWFRKNERVKGIIVYFFYFVLAFFMAANALKGDYLYIGEEFFFADAKHILTNAFSYWNASWNFGEPVGFWDHSMIIPNGFFWYLLSGLGFSAVLIQKVYLGIIFFLFFASMDVFLKIFVRNRLLRLGGTFFYVFNLVVISSLFYTAKMYQLILMPLLFWCLYNFLKTRNYKFVIYNFLLLFIFQAVLTNLSQFIGTALVYPITIFYFMLDEGLSFSTLAQKYFKKLLQFFAIAFIPIFYHLLLYGFLSFYYLKEITEHVTAFRSMGSVLFEILQFRGVWWENELFEKVPYWHLGWFYENWTLILGSFLTLALVILGGLLEQNKKGIKKFLFWLSVFVFFVIFASGFSFLGSGVYAWFLENFPLASIFREPWSKFMPLALWSFSVLVALALKTINEKKLIGKLLILFFLVLIGARSYPFIGGDIFDHENKGWKKQFVEVPGYWQDYGEWSLENKDVTVLPYPFHVFSGDLEYDWYETDLGNAAFPIYIVSSYTRLAGIHPYYSPISYFNKILEKSFQERRVDFVKLGPVNYLLEQKDLKEDEKLNGFLYQKNVKKYFKDDPFLNFQDKLFLYEIKSEFYTPLFYLPKKIAKVKDVDGLLKKIAEDNWQGSSAIFMEGIQGEALNKLVFTSEDQEVVKMVPDERVEFKRISAAKYRLRLERVSGSTLLVFSESFSKFWKLYFMKEAQLEVECQDVFLKGHTSFENKCLNDGYFWGNWLKRSLDSSKAEHLEVNGFANAWVLDTEKICANGKCSQNEDGTWNVELSLEFWPQRIFYGWIFASLAIFLAAIIFLAFLRAIKRKKDISFNGN
jgi:hypothetical protein